MGQRKKLPALPLAVSTTYSGTTASSLSYGLDTAMDPNGGRSFTAALTLTAGLFGAGVTRFVYTWLDPQRMSYGFGYDSFLVPGRTRPCPGGGPAARQRSTHHIVHNIRSGGRPHHRLAMAVVVLDLEASAAMSS